MALYLVKRTPSCEGELPRMVEARTQASAISYVARDTFSATPLTAKQAVQWSKDGVEIEEPNAEE